MGSSMKTSKPVSAILAALSLTAASAPLQAADAKNNIEFVWTIHVGGLALGTVGYKGGFGDDNYSAVSRLKTAGIVNSFYAAVIDATSTGFVRNGAIKPASYDSNYEGEKTKQRVALAYSGTGISLSADPMYDVARFPVSDADKQDTVDPLSGITQAVSGVTVSDAAPCGETIRIFDGRRRY
ncbi:MAG TPA: hypothetical protein DCL48_04770, partial [Alphaproteobacteria bacterium]|nr:hypothetical protein [Alphaproteobacteria bacterium]